MLVLLLAISKLKVGFFALKFLPPPLFPPFPHSFPGLTWMTALLHGKGLFHVEGLVICPGTSVGRGLFYPRIVMGNVMGKPCCVGRFHRFTVPKYIAHL